MNINLNEKQIKLLLYILNDYKELLGNTSCNDIPKEIQDWWTPEEGLIIAKEFAHFNNPSNPEGPSWPIPDFCLVAWLKNIIKSQAN